MMMNGSASDDNIFLKVHRIDVDGQIQAMDLEADTNERIVSSSLLDTDSVNLDNEDFSWGYMVDDKLGMNFRCTEPSSPTITMIKIGGVEELHPLNYGTQLSLEDSFDFTSVQVPDDPPMMTLAPLTPLPPSAIFRQIGANVGPSPPPPAKVSTLRCQNCENTFPTKYQYQRHQCEFNADKVVLKPNVIGKNLDMAMRIKFECDVCAKQFISKNNLDRHRISHEKKRENVCTDCNKVFVSDNRLRIHKENHCKMAGDLTKFYRSDISIWQCTRCGQVFASMQKSTQHAGQCTAAGFVKVNSGSKTNRTTPLTQAQQARLPEVFEDDIFTDNQSDYSEEPVVKIFTETLYQCEFCNQTYAGKTTLLHHQKTHTTEKNYECVECKLSFTSYIDAIAHWQSTCNKDMFFLPKMVFCDLCDRGFKSHDFLYSHKYKNKHFNLKMHIDTASNQNNEKAIVKLIEDLMVKMETRKDTRANEKAGSSNGKTAAGDDADKAEEANVLSADFSSEEETTKKRGRRRKAAKAHNDINLDFKVGEGYRYQCEKCAEVFNKMQKLEEHKETVHASCFICDQCNQVLHSSKALTIHCRAHQNLKPYVCEKCGRSYSQTSHLWQHMRFHQGIKPFACPHEGCEARYTIRPDLKDHIRKVHTRERPYKCSVCQKCFLTGSVYYQHRLIHTNDRRYACDVCGKRFFRADALNNHRRIHTDERPYPCPVCGREFRQKGDRNKHLRSQHPGSV